MQYVLPLEYLKLSRFCSDRENMAYICITFHTVHKKKLSSDMHSIQEQVSMHKNSLFLESSANQVLSAVNKDKTFLHLSPSSLWVTYNHSWSMEKVLLKIVPLSKIHLIFGIIGL